MLLMKYFERIVKFTSSRVCLLFKYSMINLRTTSTELVWSALYLIKQLLVFAYEENLIQYSMSIKHSSRLTTIKNPFKK